MNAFIDVHNMINKKLSKPQLTEEIIRQTLIQ